MIREVNFKDKDYLDTINPDIMLSAYKQIKDPTYEIPISFLVFQGFRYNEAGTIILLEFAGATSDGGTISIKYPLQANLTENELDRDYVLAIRHLDRSDSVLYTDYAGFEDFLIISDARVPKTGTSRTPEFEFESMSLNLSDKKVSIYKIRIPKKAFALIEYTIHQFVTYTIFNNEILAKFTAMENAPTLYPRFLLPEELPDRIEMIYLPPKEAKGFFKRRKPDIKQALIRIRLDNKDAKSDEPTFVIGLMCNVNINALSDEAYKSEKVCTDAAKYIEAIKSLDHNNYFVIKEFPIKYIKEVSNKFSRKPKLFEKICYLAVNFIDKTSNDRFIDINKTMVDGIINEVKRVLMIEE